jgi:hypothetical protein
LEQVAQIEAGIAAVKQVWHEKGYRAGPNLRPLLERLEHAVQALAGRVSDLQREAETRRGRLWPELEALARARQMQRAYGAAPR